MASLEPELSEVVPGVLLLGSHPERSGLLAEMLNALREREVGGVVTLTERPLDPAALRRSGLEALHLPVENGAAPSLAQLAEGVAFIEAQRTRGKATFVHCHAGIGRAGTLGAAYLIAHGAEVDEAIRTLRRLRHPLCVESDAQLEVLCAWARLKRP